MTHEVCGKLCFSNTTSSLCNRTATSCPKCLHFQPIGWVCSMNCSLPSTIVCPERLGETNITTTITLPPATTLPPEITESGPVPQPEINGMNESSLSSLIPGRSLMIVLIVSGFFLALLGCCSFIYRQRKSKRDKDNNLSIVRGDPTKCYLPEIANGKMDTWVHDFHRSTSRTQSMSKGSWLYSDMTWSSPVITSTNINSAPIADPWVFTNPYRRSSVVELVDLHRPLPEIDILEESLPRSTNIELLTPTSTVILRNIH